MKEKVKVRLILKGKVVSDFNFISYDKALDFASTKVYEGYTCLLLRCINDKEWSKIYFYPPDNL